MPERSKVDVGKLFARRREIELTWSQKETALRAGMGLATVQNAEYGKDEVTPKTYAKLARAIGWPPDAFERLLAGEAPVALPIEMPEMGAANDRSEIVATWTDEELAEADAFIQGRRSANRPTGVPENE